MSTRAQICIKRGTEGSARTGGIYIYKHCDGYPEGVMPILKPFVKAFVQDRGNDPEYLLCQIVRRFAIEDIEKECEHGFYPCYTGWGLDTVKHDDIQFLYEVCAETGSIFINGEVQS